MKKNDGRYKAVYKGPILKQNFKSDNIQRALHACDFTSEKPVFLRMGGSLGADSINQMVKTTRHELLALQKPMLLISHTRGEAARGSL
ncbi:hypothetical protein MHH56_32290 [Paenibacillus sp. FSL K6-3182]|uniref:hypothetical protein n=1 Tax=Paenibacillus sp. FSL K6-3182 TaxID=2921495 RepID=UPI0030D268B8